MTTPTPTPSPSEGELRPRLTAEQYEVTQNGGTERAFTGEYWETKTPGIYHCVVCDEALFDSDTKFDSGTGWPSFSDEISNGKVDRIEDRSHGMVRTEARTDPGHATAALYLCPRPTKRPRPPHKVYALSSSTSVLPISR